MERIFKIHFPDDCGPLWMNRDNLLLCLQAYCPNIKFEVIDITPKTRKLIPGFCMRCGLAIKEKYVTVCDTCWNLICEEYNLPY